MTEMTVIIEIKASARLLHRYRSAIFLENPQVAIGRTIAICAHYVNQFQNDFTVLGRMSTRRSAAMRTTKTL
jgi:hypothetical protein